jgi:hypothetical protein
MRTRLTAESPIVTGVCSPPFPVLLVVDVPPEFGTVDDEALLMKKFTDSDPFGELQ